MAGGFTINDTPAGGAPDAADIADAFAGDAEAAADLVTALGVAGDPGMPSSGLVALWRASSLALADGASVGTWAPVAGTPGNLTASGSARPTFRATGSPSGRAAVEFDGSDDEMSIAAPVFLPSGAAAGTLVAVVSRAKDNGSFSHIVQYGTGGPTQARGLGCNPTVWYCLDYQSELASSAADAPRHRRGVVLGHAYDGTTRRLWVDGVPVAAGAVTLATGSTALHLGRSLYGGERTAFRIMELAIYDHALTDAEWARVMAHARAAHGVA
ncbi:MAG: LamG-like jellyroll fold domain-containing protein [Polyangiales bacterium]